MKLTHYISILAIAAVFGACSKGETGPQGPQGPAGANGVSNLVISGYSISPGSWNSYNSTTWYVNTNQVVPTSDVAVVYYSLDGNSYSPLPVYSAFTSGDFLTFSFSNSGGLTLWYYFSAAQPPVTIYVNVADIPPAVQAKYPGTNWQNGMEVLQKVPEVSAALSKK